MGETLLKNCYSCKWFKPDKTRKHTAYKGQCVNPSNHKMNTDVSEVCHLWKSTLHNLTHRT